VIYFDSKTGTFTKREAAEVFSQLVTDPRFDRQRLPYFQSQNKTDLMRGFLQDNKKSFPSYPVLGINGGLAFSMCEWVEMGYGIFDGYSDGERLLSWLGPQFVLDSEKLIFRVTDWRARMASGTGSSSAWACAAITSTDVALDGCELDYCFDWDRYGYAGVPGGNKPSDTAIPCMPQYPINVFGQQISDPVAMRDWELVTKARLHMLKRLVDGDYYATTVGDAKQEDGVIKFFTNWTTRHSALSETCKTEFAPVTVSANGMSMAQFVTSVSDEFRQIEYRAKYLDGQAQINFQDVAILMNEVDAQCMNWYQACQTKCTSTFDINAPSDINAYWDYFNKRFTDGQYGGGLFRISDGRELSIMQMHNIPQGTVIMLIKGWTGSQPNAYGMRVAAMQYNEYYRRMAATSPVGAMRFQTLMNGSWLKETPIDGCGDVTIRWNQRLFSNAAWMQRKWTSLAKCSEVTLTNWPALPALPQYARCSPVNA